MRDEILDHAITQSRYVHLFDYLERILTEKLLSGNISSNRDSRFLKEALQDNCLVLFLGLCVNLPAIPIDWHLHNVIRLLRLSIFQYFLDYRDESCCCNF